MDEIAKIGLKEMKKAPWEHAHEVCSYWQGRSNLLEVAFLALLSGKDDHPSVSTAKWSVHESRWQGVIDEYDAYVRDALKWREAHAG